MKLVVDANILFSALIKDGLTSRLLLFKHFTLYAPSYALQEIATYDSLLVKKTHRSTEDFRMMFSTLLSITTLVDEEEFADSMAYAKTLCPDPNDVLYFALALHLNCSLWSNDKALKDQDVIRVFSTQDLLKQSSSFHEGY